MLYLVFLLLFPLIFLMGFLFLAFGAMVWMLSSETIVRIFSGVFMASGIFLCVKGIKFKEK